MNQRIDGIIIRDNDLAIGHKIEAELLNSLQMDLPQADNTSFVISAKDTDDALVGGLTASTSYGWLLVKSIWVAETYRNRSLGRKLLEHAEKKAKLTGCHAAWLDTSNPAARAFYLKLGYEVFGELSNAKGQPPENHHRWFMKKVLS